MPGTPVTLQTAKTAGKPNPLTGLTTSYVTFQPLAGFPAATPQDSTPYSSNWIQCAPGMTLELTLTVTSLVGTLDIEIQDMADPNDANEDAALLTQQFASVSNLPAPTALAPFVTKIVAPTKGYLRVVATPGKANGGQTAAWAITGQGFTPGRGVVQGN
jgi:hypothetical protein